MSNRGSVRSGNCPFEEMSVQGSVRRGSVRGKSASRGIVLGEVSVGELSAYQMKVACVLYYAFLGVLRYLNKACVFFCAKYLNKIIIIITIIIIIIFIFPHSV